MKLVHFSDTHLGFSEFHRADPETGVNQREQDAYDAFRRVVAAAREERPDAVVHGGDLFHTPRPSNRAIAQACEGFKELLDAGIPVVVVAGNHSTPRLRASGSIFETLEVLGVRAAYGNEARTFPVGEAVFHCVPHMPTEELLARALEETEPDPEARYNVLVTHGAVREIEGGHALGEFNEVVLGRGLLARLDGFDYVALGHYHRFLRAAPNAWYAGSTERFHLAEAGYDKGYVRVDLDGPAVSHRAMPCRDILALGAVDCAGLDGPGILAALERTLAEAGDTAGRIVTATPTAVTPAAWADFDRSALRKLAPDALHVDVRPVMAEAEDRTVPSLAIGSLPAEFSAFLGREDTEGFDKAALERLGREYLRED